MSTAAAAAARGSMGYSWCGLIRVATKANFFILFWLLQIKYT
jgi:hypothetical protein